MIGTNLTKTLKDILGFTKQKEVRCTIDDLEAPLFECGPGHLTQGYGFIQREDEGDDVFVHSSAFKNAGLKYLKEGEELTFEVEKTDKGYSAINLQKTS